jgi:ribose transport system permease protein
MTYKGEDRMSNDERKFLYKITHAREFTLFLIVLACSVVVSIIEPAFLSRINLETTAKAFATSGVIAVAMTVVLVSGGIDLSVGSVYGLSSVVVGSLFVGSGMNVWLAAVIGVLVGVAVGLFNGFLISKVGLNPLISTLASSIMARGLSLYITEGKTINLRLLPNDFRFIGSGSVLGVPFPVLFFAAIVILGIFSFKRLTVMRNVFYIGSNPKAAQFTGIRVGRIKIGVYVVSAALAAMGGIIAVARFKAALPTGGTGMEMTAIAAAVIGGASLNGGEGTVFGTMLGCILLSLIDDALVLLGISAYLQEFISGAILLISVIVDQYNKRHARGGNLS